MPRPSDRTLRSMLLHRRTVLGVPVTDVALSMVLLGASVGAIVTGQVDGGPKAISLPVAVVACVALLFRARASLAVAVVISVAGLAQTLAAGTSPGGTVMFLVILLVASWSVGAELEEAGAAIGLAVLLGSLFVQEWALQGRDYAFLTIEIGGAWLLGRAARTLRTRATYAEQHQQDVARLAVATERTRIARELHDVVAHSLSVIAVQADAAEATLATRPESAAAPMGAIRDSARDALSDMRQLLHVLRADTAEDPTTTAREPARGLVDLPTLVAGLRAAGLPLKTEIRVDRDLPAGLGLAVYRVSQEALTNVLKHAGLVETQLEICEDRDRVRVLVRNAAGPAPRAVNSCGHGLLGLRERVAATGGTLRFGPVAGGGFELAADLPLSPPALTGTAR